jgi:SAM-dependent methyltransferase
MKVPWFRSRFMVRRQLDRLLLDLPDAAFRRLTGRSDWPPYSLRSFVGGARNFGDVGTSFLEEFHRLRLFRRGTRILDVGCGCGRIGRVLAADPQLQDLEIRYTGMDIDRARIEWCQQHIAAANARFSFYHADCFNRSYNPQGSKSASTYVFPHADNSFDVILLTSVLTHLLEDDLSHFEVRRMLAPGGIAYASFFLYPSLEEAAAGATRHGIRFPFQSGHHAAVDNEDHPTNAVAYAEPYIRHILAEFGLQVIEPTLYGLQDVLLLTKAPQTYTQSELVRGWHELEKDCWRWTERAFAVRLRQTAARTEQSTLRSRFHVPIAIMSKHKRLHLRVNVNGEPLPSLECVAAGDQLYVCQIPKRMWVDGSVFLEFELDKALQPSPSDWRELGLLVGFRDCTGPLQRALDPFLLTSA